MSVLLILGNKVDKPIGGGLRPGTHNPSDNQSAPNPTDTVSFSPDLDEDDGPGWVPNLQ